MKSLTDNKSVDFRIEKLNRDLAPELKKKIDNKTKPLGSLGRLEDIALQIGQIQNTLSPALYHPVIVLFAGDHGIAREGVSPYPQEVTHQMVYNFLNGGAAINVFAEAYQIDVKVVDAGVNHLFPTHPQLIDAKMRAGTKNFMQTAAMTSNECQMAMEMAASIVDECRKEKTNVIGFGEMGIGNTSSAALIMHLLTQIPLYDCVGSGTGLDDEGVEHKYQILKKALDNHQEDFDNPLKVLATFGGFEIAMIAGAILKAAELKMVILIDGFITTSALLVAFHLFPEVLDYCIFTHQSDEKGHRAMLEFMGVKPILHLDLRLGEGTGAALAYPVVTSAVNFLNKMASFDDAKVSKKQV